MNPIEMRQENFETCCADGVLLSGTLLIPNHPKAVIQFNCGTATKKEFYLPFLSFLCQHGYVCCLWNYRGTSPHDNLKNSSIQFSDYGRLDMPAIKSYLNQRFPTLPFLIVGHSAGGQQIGFMPDLRQVQGAILLAVSSGYYGNMPFFFRMKSYFFFYVFAPLSVVLNGYVRAKPYGFMENLPRKVMTQWRSWLEKKDYFFDPKFDRDLLLKHQFKTFEFPMHVYYSTDDTISNAKNVRSFWQHIQSTKPITFYELTPKMFDLSVIDHFGYFRKNMKDKLWPDILKRLDDMLENQ